MLPSYSDAGITSLVIDMRNDPGAPDDPTGIYRFGLTEWEDVEGAVQYALANGAEEIILAGYSTGSSAHLAFLENSDLADRVTAVVFDSPNIAMGETVKVEAAKRTIPGTPIPIPGSLTWAALLISDVRWDVNWGEVDYRERAPALLTMPTLVFHGADDQRVPLEFSEQLADNVPTIRLVVTPEAGHVRSWNIDPQAYLEQLTDFLESVS